MTPRPRTGPPKPNAPKPNAPKPNAPKPNPPKPAAPRPAKQAGAKQAGAKQAGAPAAAAPPDRGWQEIAVRVAASVVAVWAAALLAVYGAFMTPFRVGGLLMPISVVLGIGGNVGIIWFAYRMTRNKILALLPGVVWVVLSIVAAGPTTERDLVLYQGNWVAITYLYGGCAAVGVCAYRLIVPKRPPMP